MKTKQTRSASPKEFNVRRLFDTPALRGFDVESVLAVQQQAAAAVMATMQELLRGMQEMSIRQFTLFGQAFQQAVEGGYGVLQATNMADACDHCAKCSQAITETTLRSVHEAVTATCKCGSDVLSAFHGQTASGKSTSAAHPVGAAPEKAAA